MLRSHLQYVAPALIVTLMYAAWATAAEGPQAAPRAARLSLADRAAADAAAPFTLATTAGGQCSLQRAGGGRWQDVKPGQTLDDGYVVRAVSLRPAPWVALEKEDSSSGEILFVDVDGKTTRIKKTLDAVGPKSDPPPVVQYPREFWNRLLTQKNDFLAEKYLAEKNAKNEDPTFADIQKLFPPILYPETMVGMNSFPHAIGVSATGSVETHLGFVSGVELSYPNICGCMQFKLNGRTPSAKECEATISRRLLGGWMPATDYRYRRDDQPVGWEQVVMMGNCQGRPGLFIRFRIVNLDTKRQNISFAVEPPATGRFTATPEGLFVHVPKVVGGMQAFDNDPIRTNAFRTMQAAAPRAVPFSVSRPCAMPPDRPSWSFNLPAGGSQDLILFYPGYHNGKLVRLPDADTVTAFYAALKDQYESWSDYLAKGADITIPEPGLEDIFRATVCHILTTAHGDKFEGGLNHYRGFWQFTHLHTVRLMLDAGQFAKARSALVYFMDKRILPNGKFWFDWNQGMYQIFDIGEFMQTLAKYYETTGDASLIFDYQVKIDSTLKYLRDNRARSLAKFPVGDPRHGMLTGSFENDVPEQAYYYTNDTHVWFGLRDYANILRRIAATEQGRPLAKKATAFSAFADEFGRTLRASITKAGIIRDSGGTPYAFHCEPNLQGEGIKSRYFTVTKWDIYRRFHQQPRQFAHSIMTDEETAAFLDFQAKNDQTILGVRRWKPEVIDDFVAFEIDYQRLRLGRVREFQMKYFAYLQALTAVGTWTGFEETQIAPLPGFNARRPMNNRKFGMNDYEGLHGTIVTPMLLKQMFCFDEPTADAVWLAAGVSTNWLKDGKPLIARRMGCRYGLVDLSLTWNASVKTLTAEINPQPGRTMTEVRLRMRAPGGPALKRATLGDGATSTIQGDLVILKNLSQPVRVTGHFGK